jgi:hypothetical protein
MPWSPSAWQRCDPDWRRVPADRGRTGGPGADRRGYFDGDNYGNLHYSWDRTPITSYNCVYSYSYIYKIHSQLEDTGSALPSSCLRTKHGMLVDTAVDMPKQGGETVK